MDEFHIKDKVKVFHRTNDSEAIKELGIGYIGGFRYDYAEPIFCEIYFKNSDGEYSQRSEIIPIESKNCYIKKY